MTSEASRVEKSIPLLAYGWSPGQATIMASIMKSNPQMDERNETNIHLAVSDLVGGAFSR